MANLSNGCKNCTKRYLGCHDKCNSYAEYKKKLEELSAKRQKLKAENDPFVEIKIKAKRKSYMKHR